MRQTTESKKERLLVELCAARRELLDAALALPEAGQDTAFLGSWSVKDILAHLVGWDYANIEAMAAVRSGQLPAFYAYYDPDWRSFNADLVLRCRHTSLTEAIAAAEASHRDLRAAVEAVPAEALFKDHGVRSPRGRRVTIAMLLDAEAGDERKHRQQIEEFTRSNPS
ncbi:MAG TPA: DinB family protein [Anaerolineae bacterium]|nr:DinB family protein [Anaerolineae bacterium]